MGEVTLDGETISTLAEKLDNYSGLTDEERVQLVTVLTVGAREIARLAGLKVEPPEVKGFGAAKPDATKQAKLPTAASFVPLGETKTFSITCTTTSSGGMSCHINP
jgi:hypothetical protein